MASCFTTAHSGLHAFAQAYPQDFSSSAIEDSDYEDQDQDMETHGVSQTPLLFRFSPPERPTNPLRFIEAKLRESKLRHVTTHHTYTQPFTSQTRTPPDEDDEDMDTIKDASMFAFRETELIFAPMPFRGRPCRPRRFFGSISSVSGGDDSVEFEVVGVNFQQENVVQETHGDEEKDIEEDEPMLQEYQYADEYSSSAIANATLFDQEHYHILFRKLQSLQLAGHNDEEDDLISPPSPARIQVPFTYSVETPEISEMPSPASESSSREEERRDGVFTPPRQSLSVLPTPLSSREPSPNPVDREKIEKEQAEAAAAMSRQL